MNNIQTTINQILGLEVDDITVSSEADDFGKEELLSPSPADRFRTTGVSSESVTIDFGSAVEIDRLVLQGHNLTNGSTITLKADDNSGFTSPESVSITWRSGVIITDFTGMTYRYWKLEIADSGNSDGYLELGMFLLGKTEEFNAYLPRGWERTRLDPAKISVAASGKKFRTTYNRSWRFSITFTDTNPLNSDDYSLALDLLDSVGAGGPVLVCLKQDSEIYDYTIWAEMSSFSPLKVIVPGFWSWGFIAEELL